VSAASLASLLESRRLDASTEAKPSLRVHSGAQDALRRAGRCVAAAVRAGCAGRGSNRSYDGTFYASSAESDGSASGTDRAAATGKRGAVKAMVFNGRYLPIEDAAIPGFLRTWPELRAVPVTILSMEVEHADGRVEVVPMVRGDVADPMLPASGTGEAKDGVQGMSSAAERAAQPRRRKGRARRDSASEAGAADRGRGAAQASEDLGPEEARTNGEQEGLSK